MTAVAGRESADIKEHTAPPAHLGAHPDAHGAVVVRSAAPTPILELLNPAATIRRLWSQRELIRQFTAREVAARHRGRHLGVLWMFLTPLATLAVYTLVFGLILQSRWDRLGGQPAEFPITMLAGATIFAIFSDCVIASPEVILQRPNYVTRVVFPLEIFPVSLLGATVVYSGAMLLLVVAATWVMLGAVSSTIWLFPLVLVPLVLLTLGVSWLLASLGVFLRDMGNIVSLVVGKMLMFMTPIFYPVERVPEPYRTLIELNPLTVLVENARRTLMWGQMPEWASLGAVTVLSLVVCQAGYAWFLKSKRGFADVL